MNINSLLFLSLALSLDAFAVSISCGLKLNKFWPKKFLKIALFFAFFQTVMPLLGWGIGRFAKNYVADYAQWLAFTIFFLLGIKTIYSAMKRSSFVLNPMHVNDFRRKVSTAATTANTIPSSSCSCNNWSCIIGLSIATSIDALLIGPILALYDISMLLSVLIIGGTTFTVCMIGPMLGHKSNRFLGNKTEILAGIILICLAVKFLLD